MQTKAYFASSVPAAFEVARQELGENALLVSSKPAPPEVRQYGRWEVTFAWDPADCPSGGNQSRRIEPEVQHRSATPSSHHLCALPAAAARVIFTPPGQVGTENGFASDQHMAERLATAGFSRGLAAEIAAAAARRSGNGDLAVVEELASRIPTAPFLDIKPGENRTLAFIGPPGRGKTVSLIKIAINRGLARHIPVRIYCAGAHAIGAQEQLARFAAILNIPFQAFESLANLNLAMNGEGWTGMTLIDTPGISPADRSELAELKNFFADRPEFEKHLVLRSDANSADMLHAIFRFSGLAPSRLLFTGTDEAVRVAPAIETLIRGEIPATFAGTGQQIPEDLEEVNAERLAQAVWVDAGATDEFARAVAA